ncbi:MAG: hypothetical protein H0U23_06350 [Blastocatellia bacterium]|nr:hypothetical protein [Blastocatellia bacterium]
MPEVSTGSNAIRESRIARNPLRLSFQVRCDFGELSEGSFEVFGYL